MLLQNSLAAAGMGLFTLTAAQTYPTDLVGTWSTKSNKTLTGPGFYDPLNERLIEPSHPGISYSFTADGHYEEAYFRANSNPVNPSCPSAIMQWQHGTFVKNANGSLTLSPIEVDGRQLVSEPCNGANSAVYTRYNQSEYFKGYEVLTDPYHQIPRLNLAKFDGSPMIPMYLVYSPPEMLPTTTLNPLPTSSGAAAATSGSSKKAKRGLQPEMPPLRLNWNPTSPDGHGLVHRINAERLWWVGLAFTGVGGLLYFGPRRLGLRI